MSDETSAEQSLRIGYVRGVTLAKWRGIWAERYSKQLVVSEIADAAQLGGVRDGSLDMAFVRLPIDRDGLHAIPLYEEVMVAWVAKDHLLSAADELTLADLDGETVLTDPGGIALDRVLGGAVLVVPMSIARGASRRDLRYRPIVDAETSQLALVWRVDNEHPLIDEFIGVVRGRRATSSRGRATQDDPGNGRNNAAKSKRGAKGSKSSKTSGAADRKSPAKRGGAKPQGNRRRGRRS